MHELLLPDRLEGVTILLPVIDETDSLRQTIAVIEGGCGSAVTEYLIVVCRKTTPASRAVCGELGAQFGARVRVLEQTRPYLGGAMQDAFAAVRSTHCIMMASDLETPPEAVKAMIELGRADPQAIVTGSRWRSGGGFQGYSRAKYVLNWVFQRLFSALYRTRLTDMTYGYRLFPTALVQAIRWEELRHAFLFETLVKPLRLGIRVLEVPAAWKARGQGASQNTFAQNFVYFRIGFKTLRYSAHDILRRNG